MSLQKHEREAIKVAQALHPDIKAHVETQRKNTHPVLVVCLGKITVRNIMSSSPRDENQHAQVVRQQVARMLREKGAQL